jgi:hypothetical protein
MRPPYYAGPHGANRKVARAESADLIHWSVPQVVLDTDALDSPAADERSGSLLPTPAHPNDAGGKQPGRPHRAYPLKKGASASATA